MAVLLVEQGQLASLPGARPEAVGRAVGLWAATAFSVACVVALLLPERWLIAPHHLLSAALVLGSMFVPILDAPLPCRPGSVDTASLGHLGKVGLAAAGLVLLGACLGPAISRPPDHNARSPLAPLSPRALSR